MQTMLEQRALSLSLNADMHCLVHDMSCMPCIANWTPLHAWRLVFTFLQAFKAVKASPSLVYAGDAWQGM